MKDNAKLVALKEKFDSYKVELKVAEKELVQIQTKLKEEYQIKTIGDAEEYIKDLQNEVEELIVKRDKKIKQIEAKLANYRR